MLHFFPRNYHSRRIITPSDRRSSLGIHSLATSKQQTKQFTKLNKSQTISVNSRQNRTNDKVMKYNGQQNSYKLMFKRQQKDQNGKITLKQRKKTLFIKGFCKNPSLQFQINNQKQFESRQVITSNCRRLKKVINQNGRLGTSIPLEQKTKPHKQFILNKRKSKDYNFLKGWDINDQEFADF